jgi:hypothetical protein
VFFEVGGRRPLEVRGRPASAARPEASGGQSLCCCDCRRKILFSPQKKVAAILILPSINVRHCKKHRAHWTGKWRDDQRQSENLSFFRRTRKVPPSGERLSLFRLSVLESPKSVAPTLWTSGAPTAGCRQPASVKFVISAQF